MAQDHGLRKTFRDFLLPRGFDVVAIETRGVATGAPDANYCKRGIELWIEHKRVEKGCVTIRPAQVGWIERRLDHGGRVFIATRLRGEMRLFHGCTVRMLQDEPIAEVPFLGRWYGSPADWDWAAVEGFLLGINL